MKKLLSFACAIAVGVALSNISYADVVDNNGDGFIIPDDNPDGASSNIVFNGTNQVVDGDIEVTLFGANHSWVGDLVVTIGNTQSGSIDLMFRTGSGNGNGPGDSTSLGDDYTFVSFQNADPNPPGDPFDGGGDWWAAADIAGGGDNMPGGSILYGATTLGGGESDLAAFFVGDSTDDAWTLSISDNAGGDTGFIDGWGIAITSSAAIPEPGSLALLGALGLACVIRRRR